VSNIFEGLIWFLLPSALIITNDIMAYLAGKAGWWLLKTHCRQRCSADTVRSCLSCYNHPRGLHLVPAALGTHHHQRHHGSPGW
jgi:hypothetical protein